jgi:hypothetical protein
MPRKTPPEPSQKASHEDLTTGMNPLYMTYSGSIREVHVSKSTHDKLCAIAVELNVLPSEVAASWLEHVTELHV